MWMTLEFSKASCSLFSELQWNLISFSLQKAATEGKITAWQSGLYGTLLQHWRGIRIGRLLDKEWENPGMAGGEDFRRGEGGGGYFCFCSGPVFSLGGK